LNQQTLKNPLWIFAKPSTKSHSCAPFGETGNAACEETISRKINIMGDKSPKSVNKQASQKQAKASGAMQKKQQAIAAKQAAGKKK
jgi:hypothetical protein